MVRSKYGYPAKQGLYSPEFEREACGVGFVAKINGEKSHQVLSEALTVLERMKHRGACGFEENCGEGAGVMTGIPHSFYQRVIQEKKLGFKLPSPGDYATGIFFIDTDLNKISDSPLERAATLLKSNSSDNMSVNTAEWSFLETDTQNENYHLSSQQSTPLTEEPLGLPDSFVMRHTRDESLLRELSSRCRQGGLVHTALPRSYQSHYSTTQVTEQQTIDSLSDLTTSDRLLASIRSVRLSSPQQERHASHLGNSDDRLRADFVARHTTDLALRRDLSPNFNTAPSPREDNRRNLQLTELTGPRRSTFICLRCGRIPAL